MLYQEKQGVLFTEDSECTDPKNIANVLEDHFATVGPKLAAKIPNRTYQNSSTNDMDLDESKKFKLQRVSEEYIKATKVTL